MTWFSAWSAKPHEVSQLSPRDRRLAADARAIAALVADSAILRADGKGNPPNQYRFRFEGKGLALDAHGNVVVQNLHEVWVELGAAYPRLMPTLQWKTPIFHPNISVNGIVCLGGYGTHWVPSLTLDELCNMIWDMVRMKNFDIASPYNREASVWLRDQSIFQFPLDPRALRNLVQIEAEVTASQSSGIAGSMSSGGIEIIESGIEIVQSRTSPKVHPDVVFID